LAKDIPSIHDAIRALLLCDIRAQAVGVDRLVDQEGRPIELSRDARPSAVAARLALLPSDTRLLLLAGRATPGIVHLAQSDHRILGVTRNSVIAEGRVFSREGSSVEKTDGGRGPVPYVRYAVARALVASDYSVTQENLAAMLHVSQQAVSHALTRLRDELAHETMPVRGLEVPPIYTYGDNFTPEASQPIELKSREGWQASDPFELGAWVLRHYPGAGGLTTYWWHNESLEAQYEIAKESTPDMLLSGDLAADRIWSWRSPQHVLCYHRTPVNPIDLGFAMASEDDYSLALTIPRDQTLWATSALFGADDLADPIITAHDVVATGTTGDEREAALRMLASAIAKG
jgi:hypothetical protein